MQKPKLEADVATEQKLAQTLLLDVGHHAQLREYFQKWEQGHLSSSKVMRRPLRCGKKRHSRPVDTLYCLPGHNYRRQIVRIIIGNLLDIHEVNEQDQ